MTWLWISAIAVLFGAEVDAEMEHQTARDNTEGSPKPMGARGAEMADTMGSAKADCGRRAFAAKLILDVAMKRRRISSAALTALVLVFPRLAGSGEAILTVNRQKLQIETLGEFGPAVVFFSGSRQRFLHLEACLVAGPVATFARVVLYDRAGLGQSKPMLSRNSAVTADEVATRLHGLRSQPRQLELWHLAGGDVL